jgi:ABC-type transport system involved in cytochrome c biogenesis permease subunit
MKHFLLALALSLPVIAAEPLPTLDQLRDAETVRTFSTLPVQESGRIKPLDTVARYRLLRFHGTRTLRFENPETGKSDELSAMEWLLVSWFRPDLAKDLPLFRVDSPDAITEIGATAKGRMEGVRGKYTYNDILPHRNTLMEKAEEYRQMDAKKRTPVQTMIANLGINYLDYEMILTHWDLFRAPFGKNESSLPPELAKTIPKPYRIANVIPAVFSYLEKNPDAAAPMSNPWMMDFLKGALGGMMTGNREMTFRIFPPTQTANEQWHGPGPIIMENLQSKKVLPYDLDWMTQYENIYLSAGNPEQFKQAVTTFAEKAKAGAAARNEGQFVDLEASYHRTDYFYYSLCFFVLGLVLLNTSWAVPGSKYEKAAIIGTWLSVLVATAYCTTGIVVRCIIMPRPPIATLYENIIFIAATGALFGIIAEWVSRNRFGLLVATLAGVAGLFLSIRYETNDAQDTLVQLQAVLITNFWLATHVPLINLGYSAAMVAAIASMVYFIRRLFNNIQEGDESARSITRMSYGFLAAGLFLSLVGTVLGGIWANDSWGRFWGWDPKENGALMIVLMILITLHARLGGYIRETGIHCCNLLLGCITVFSWFGTNQLGVGLHAYGFTDGVWGWLRAFWVSQLVLLALAAYLKFRDNPQRLKGEKNLPRNALPAD